MKLQLLILLLFTYVIYGDPTKEADKAIRAYKPIDESYQKSIAKGKGKEEIFNSVKKSLDAVFAVADDEKIIKYIINLISDKRTPSAARGYAMRKCVELASYGGDLQALGDAIKKEVSGGRACPQLLDVLARMKPNDCARAFGRYVQSKDPITQMAGLMGLGNSGGISDRSLINTITNLGVGARRHGLRWACCRALGSSMNKDAVPGLIKMLKLPGGYKEARKALIRLTGQVIDGSNAWASWWEKNEKTFTPVDNLELAEESTRALNEENSFYGLEVEGDPIIFLLDASMSMKGEKWEKLKEESAQMLAGLSYDLDFAVLMFPQLEKTFPDKGYDSDKSAEATTFINYVELKYQTPIGKATYQALNDHMSGGKNIPDTIYLLTDGRPTDARAIDELDCIYLALFPGNSIRVHTVCIGSDTEMLKKISDEHGGNMVQINVGKKKKKK